MCGGRGPTGRTGGRGSELWVSRWVQPLTLHLLVSTECSRRPEPCAWQHSPQRWDAGRPHPAGFLSGMCWAPSVSCSFRSRPGPGRREGGRERQVKSSSVCHGLNTVALCWFQPFPSLSPPLPKPEEGRKEMESSPHSPLRTCCHFCPSWFPSHQLRRHSPPLVREAVGLLPRPWGAVFYNKRLFFFLNK